LAEGMAVFTPEEAAAHRAKLLTFQNPDGGFRGRDTSSDVYYTSFAIRGLALLDGLDEHVCRRAADYLRPKFDRPLALVDVVSLFYSALHVQLAGGEDLFGAWAADWPDRLAAMLETYRVADGGYAKTHEGASGSTYNSFLVVLCQQLLGKPTPDADALIQFLHSRRRDDGGFVEIRPMRRGGTNPTAAAVAVLKIFHAVDETVVEDVRRFLKQVVDRDGGGFLANTQIPICDLLSTFTGVVTARDLGLLDVLDRPKALAFARSLAQPDGGFLAAAWDREVDPEYTFYGLGTLALLAGDD
ncbi:MAG: prenyltransferase/squalene oxidase repeat-containing protein, partial [Planctomycetia bacterium]